MKSKFLVFLIFITAITGFSQQTQNDDEWFLGKPIRDISFSGLRNISSFELEALVQQYRGRIYDDVIFWEMQGKLYALEYFDRIEPSLIRSDPEGSAILIRFNVIERPIIGAINFIGNSGLRNRELTNVISTKVSDILNHAKIRIDTEAIINKYMESGYPNVTVVTEELPMGDGAVVLNFRITEQDRISISRIEFQGNTRFSNNTLRSQLSLKQRSLINNGAFQEAKLLADIETITRYYNDRGYIDAVVVDVTRTYDQDNRGTNLVLTFMIEEGNEFRFGGITFEGNVIFSTEQLEKLVTSKVGDIVNSSRLEMDLQNVADLYFENGYIFNSITRIPEKNYQANVLSYTISIVERNRAYIESITIIGNDKTKTDVILREIPLEPGDVFSRTKVIEAMQNLYNLQYFSLVIPDTLQGSTENLMDLVFTVEEQMTSDIQLGLTFSGSADPDTFPVSGLFELSDRNIAGTGNEIGVKANSSIIDSTSVEFNYLHRWAFGLPLSLGVDFSADFLKRLTSMRNQVHWFNGDEPEAFPDGFSSYNEYSANNKLPPNNYMMNYDQWYLSLGLSSGYRWSTLLGRFGINGGVRIGLVRDSYNDIFEPFDPVLRARNKEWIPSNSLSMSLSLDRRDIFYDPSRGFYLLQRMGLNGIFKNEQEHYLRSDSKAQYFLTLFDIPVTDRWSFKSVLAVNLGLSFIYRQPRRASEVNPLMPVIKEANKLAVDGMFVGRGWSESFSEKGLTLIDNWVELRFPLVRGILAFDAFFDMAGVESVQGNYFKEGNFSIDNFRFSFGGGLRVALPQFPIRVSLAKRFRFIDGDFTWVQGAILQRNNRPTSGLDLVISFVMSY